VHFIFTIDDPEAFAKHMMKNPIMQEVQKKLSEDRLAQVEPAFVAALQNSKLEDGTLGRRITALTGVGYKP
jgi:cytochrome c553